MKPSVFPQELVDLIIDKVASSCDSNPELGRTAALSACALTSPAFYPSASRHLFSRITISTHHASLKRQTSLYEAFCNHPELLMHVRSLSVVVVILRGESNPLRTIPIPPRLGHANSAAENQANKLLLRNSFLLSLILRLMTRANLESLSIEGEPGYLAWDALTDQARASFFALRNHPSLKSLHLTRMLSVERAFIIGNPDYNTLQCLSLGYGLSNIPISENTAPSIAQTFHFLLNLKRLTLTEDMLVMLFPWRDSHSPIFQLPSTLASSGSGLNNLTHLALPVPRAHNEVQLLWSLLKHATQSLKYLELQLVEPDAGDLNPSFPGPIRLDGLHVLRKLNLREDGHWNWHHAFGCLTPINEFLGSPNSPTNVEHLALLFRCIINKRSPGEGWKDLLCHKTGWRTLDKILTGGQFPSLRIVDLSINFHFGRLSPFSGEGNLQSQTYENWAKTVLDDLRMLLPTLDSSNSMTLNISLPENSYSL